MAKGFDLVKLDLIVSNWIKRVKVSKFWTLWVNVDIIGGKAYKWVKLCLIGSNWILEFCQILSDWINLDFLGLMGISRSKYVWLGQSGSKCFKMILIGFEFHILGQSTSKWVKLDQKWSNLVWFGQIGSKGSNLVNFGLFGSMWILLGKKGISGSNYVWLGQIESK